MMYKTLQIKSCYAPPHKYLSSRGVLRRYQSFQCHKVKPVQKKVMKIEKTIMK